MKVGSIGDVGVERRAIESDFVFHADRANAQCRLSCQRCCRQRRHCMIRRWIFSSLVGFEIGFVSFFLGTIEKQTQRCRRDFKYWFENEKKWMLFRFLTRFEIEQDYCADLKFVVDGKFVFFVLFCMVIIFFHYFRFLKRCYWTDSTTNVIDK